MSGLTKAQRRSLVAFDAEEDGLREANGILESFRFNALCRRGLIERVTKANIGGIFYYYRITPAGRQALEAKP